MNEPKIVGEGSFGCVTKPSIKCKNKVVSYKNKISKIMRKEDALDEYKEMKSITSHKGIEKYIISMPDICEPQINEIFRKTVKKCENEKFPSMKANDFTILVMEDGGISLTDILENVVPKLQFQEICVFLSSFYNLFEGLFFFYKNDIVHHDIKEQNIVYNINTGKMRYIDFGLMKKRSVLIKESINSENSLAVQWFNFPPEYNCANYNEFKNCKIKIDYKEFIQRVAYTFDSYSLMRVFINVMIKIGPSATWVQNTPYECNEELIDFIGKFWKSNIEERTYRLENMMKSYKSILKKFKIWRTDKPKSLDKTIKNETKMAGPKLLNSQEKNILLNNLQIKAECRLGYKFNEQTKKCVKKSSKTNVRKSIKKG